MHLSIRRSIDEEMFFMSKIQYQIAGDIAFRMELEVEA
jgi:hypothetical protein